MDGVRLMGVVPLECRESVPILHNQNLKEYDAWCIDHKICTTTIRFFTKVRKMPFLNYRATLNVTAVMQNFPLV